jgi:ATP-dependent helicase/nuclease subunit A
MKNIEYINAGAGSGKTHKLTTELVNLLKTGAAKPEQVILTTFTKKAANEFKEKVKAALYREGLYDKAIRLDQALIGTVHSVCERFIAKYWFLIGLTPDMGVMSEEDTQFYISQSLAGLPTENEQKILYSFVREFNVQLYDRQSHSYKGFDFNIWQQHLKRIIEFTTNYGINNYKLSEENSLDFIKQFVDDKVITSYTAAQLKEILDEHRNFLLSQKDSEKKTKRLNTLTKLSRGYTHPTITWFFELSNLICELNKRGEKADKFVTDTGKVMCSRHSFELQKDYIHTLFELANRWRDQYAAFKREKNLLDFNDMEKYMLELMQCPEVCSELSSSFTHLFVDEFQDSSPIQVKIFDRLSDFMKQSYWVGDYKQSIYGFRGSDISLVKAVVDYIATGANGCKVGTPLDNSYRSLPDIVDTCNHIFEKTFSNVLGKKNIVLNKKRENTDDICSLRYFRTSKDVNVADHIASLVLKDKVLPNEIGVLARENDELTAIADRLTAKYNIPVTIAGNSVTQSLTFILVTSLLQIADSNRNTLAKAQVAWLTQNGFELEDIINKKMAIDDKTGIDSRENYLDEIPLIASLHRMLDSDSNLKMRSISALVESIILGLGLHDVVKSLNEPVQFAHSCLQAIIKGAKTYESRCQQMNMAATITGFISYLTDMNPAIAGDEKGVQLYTYHGCKGLEQKYTILTSLDKDAPDDTIIRNEIYGVHFAHNAEPTAKELYPEIYIRLTPWIFGTKKTAAEEIRSKILNSKEFDAAKTDSVSEANRLLYVGMTRPRDVLILDIKEKNPLQWFIRVGYDNITAQPTSGEWDIFGTGIPFHDISITETDIEEIAGMAVENPLRYRLKTSDDVTAHRNMRHVTPSHIQKKDDIDMVKNLNKRIDIHSSSDTAMNLVGDCIHQVYSFIEDTSSNQLADKIDHTVKNNSLSEVIVKPSELIDAWHRLTDFITKQHGTARKTYHERPFRYSKDGQDFIGSIDLVWQTEEGDVLIDYKTCPMGTKDITNPDSSHFAGLYAGQQNLYAEALEAAGEKVIAKYLYYPVSGLVIKLK